MSLSIQTQGVKGNKTTEKKSVGYVCSWLGFGESIEVDSFQGQGENYKERESPEIRINDNGLLIFKGTLKELKEKLSK